MDSQNELAGHAPMNHELTILSLDWVEDLNPFLKFTYQEKLFENIGINKKVMV